MSDFKNFKCAKCNVALHGPPNPNPDDMLSCPSCGAGDTVERVAKEVHAYVMQRAADKLARAATKGPFPKGVKITRKPGPRRSFRFIVDIDP